MKYLIAKDYDKLIKKDNLSQITENIAAVLTDAEDAALAEVKSYLEHRYDIASIFKATDAYAAGARYFPGDRATITTGTGDAAVTDIYYIIGNIYNYRKNYDKDTEVIFRNVRYKALLDVPKQTSPLNTTYWKYVAAVTAVTAISPTDTGQTKWQKGDNRNAQIVLYIVDIILYHIHSRINPRQVPELRGIRYTEAVKWLDKVSKGSVTADLPVIEPKQGGSIRWGSSKKQNFDY